MVSQNLYTQWKKEESMPFEGWDFSYLKDRLIESEPPWNYIRLAKELVQKATSVLDMATGGGEIFSQLAPFPKHAVAIEGWEPNVSVAAKRLEPLGVTVMGIDPSKVLPFKDGEFDLIVNRHGAFHVEEVARVLTSGGLFFSQQVAGDNLKDLQDFFNVDFPWRSNTLDHMKPKFEEQGFAVKRSEEWHGKATFLDVGALIYFLKVVPWVIKNFSVDAYLPYLEKLQERVEKGEKLEFTYARYLIHAQKN